jgi:TonB family protein
MPLLLTMLAMTMAGQDAPPPAAAPAPTSTSRPRPKGMPQTWVTNDDYPPLAMLVQAEGWPSFRISVGADGAVTGCNITTSSGWSLLDNRACELMRERAEFEPARDATGRAIASSWPSRFRWMLDMEAQAPASWTRLNRVTFDPSNTLVGCAVQSAGPVPGYANPCVWLQRLRPVDRAQLLGENHGGAVIEVREAHVVDGAEASAIPAGVEVLALVRLRYTIGKDGTVSGCTLVEARGLGQAGDPPRACPSRLRYFAPADGKPHRVTSMRAVLRLRLQPQQPVKQPFRAGPGETIT